MTPTDLPARLRAVMENGERLGQPTFHARYESMRYGFRAELIGGEVHVPSLPKRPHARAVGVAHFALMLYEDATPGTESHSGTPIILGPESEPHPDVGLLIRPEAGGRVRFKDDHVVGAPELVVDVATPEYAAFVAELARRRGVPSP